MLLAVMSAYGCSPAGGGVATAPTDAPVYLDGVCADYVLDPPCGCGSDASAFLFVGVLGLGLKRRT